MGYSNFDYKLELQTQDRKKNIEKYIGLSKALNCGERYWFKFYTKDYKVLEFLINNFDIENDQVSGFYNLKPEEEINADWLPDLFLNNDIYSGNLRFENLLGNSYNTNHVSISFNNSNIESEKMRGFYFKVGTIETKDKAETEALINYKTKQFNEIFTALGLSSSFSIGKPDNGDDKWKKGKGVKFNLSENDRIECKVFNGKTGCDMIQLQLKDKDRNKEFSEKLLNFILTNEMFKEKKSSYSINSKAIELVKLVNKSNFKLENISNASYKFKDNEQVFKIFELVNDFNGSLSISKPYSFANTTDNNLNLILFDHKLSIEFNTGMKAESSIANFKALVKEKTNEYIIFEGEYD